VDRKFHLHLISDSTGDTLNAMANAAMAQFENVDVQIHSYALVRSEHQLTRALDHVATAPGLVFFTLANPTLNQKLVARCAAMPADCIDVLEAPLNMMGRFFGKSESHKVGRQHQVDQRYLERIETLNFAIAHDDGQSLEGLGRAEVVLTGASRTSKTPTCVYLANRGVRAANVPLVPLVPPPAELESATRPLVVGLITDPERLVQIRVNRLRLLQQDTESEYTDMERVQSEIQDARRLYARRKWATIDVTRRSIEETAAAIMQMLATRRAQKQQAL